MAPSIIFYRTCIGCMRRKRQKELELGVGVV